jgi:hypothetical protein
MELARRAEHPDVIATVTFRPPADGGREAALPHGPLRVIMTVGDRNFDVRLHLSRQALPPGRETAASIYFLNPHSAREYIKSGQRFTLRDWRVIADGMIERAEFPPG